jgi:hypothetical protein
MTASCARCHLRPRHADLVVCPKCQEGLCQECWAAHGHKAQSACHGRDAAATGAARAVPWPGPEGPQGPRGGDWEDL